jgi:NADH dehydrogenase FAD-containing subunit
MTVLTDGYRKRKNMKYQVILVDRKTIKSSVPIIINNATRDIDPKRIVYDISSFLVSVGFFMISQYH